MRGRRAKDRLVGALALLAVQLVAVVVLWWWVTEPREERRETPAGQEERPAAAAPAQLEEDEVWLGDLDLVADTLVGVDAELVDVRASLVDVVAGPDGLVGDRVMVEATVPFAVLADEIGGTTTVSAAEDGQATMVRSVEVLGRELRVAATGTVDVEGGRVVLEPRSIDVGGPAFVSESTADVVRRLGTFEYAVEGVPEGLVLEDVTVQDDGLRVRLDGTGAALLP